MNASFILRRAVTVLLVAAVFAGTFAFVRWWDFTLPSVGHSRYQAVFLSNGQAFFGRYYDRLGPYVKVVSPYYIQTAQAGETQTAESRIVRRGNELHGPMAEMLVPKSAVLFVEDLADASPVAEFMANDSP